MNSKIIVLCLFLYSNFLQAKPQEIILWYSLAGHTAQQFKHITSSFNQSQDNFVVKPVYKGEYTDTLTSFAAAFRARKPPAIVQVFEVGTATMINPKGIIKPLAQLMAEQGMHLPLDDFLPVVRAYYSKNNALQAMPFNVSIPVIYYNADALAKLGISEINFPKTWQALEELIIKLKQSGYACGYTSAYPAWINIESYAALHGLPMVKNGHSTLNNQAIVTHLQRLKHWQNLHYFEYGGRRNEATVLFTSGRCALFSQSSGAYNGLSELVKFKVGVAALPLDKNISKKRHNNLIGGAALWAVAGLSDEMYQGIAQFFTYIAQTSTQQFWHENTGYIPLGLEGCYKEITNKSKQPALTIAQQELNNTENKITYYPGPQNQIRTVHDEALEIIFAGIKTPEEAMRDAARRSDYLLLRFSKNLHAT